MLMTNIEEVVVAGANKHAKHENLALLSLSHAERWNERKRKRGKNCTLSLALIWFFILLYVIASDRARGDKIVPVVDDYLYRWFAIYKPTAMRTVNIIAVYAHKRLCCTQMMSKYTVRCWPDVWLYYFFCKQTSTHYEIHVSNVIVASYFHKFSSLYIKWSSSFGFF